MSTSCSTPCRSSAPSQIFIAVVVVVAGIVVAGVVCSVVGIKGLRWFGVIGRYWVVVI